MGLKNKYCNMNPPKNYTQDKKHITIEQLINYPKLARSNKSPQNDQFKIIIIIIIALAHTVVEGELNFRIRISRKTTKYSNVLLCKPFLMSFDNRSS